MAKTEDVRDSQITIRIPTWVRKALEMEARTERRSIADIIVFTLEAKFEKSHSLVKVIHSKPKGGK
jgi:hypothetical protein